jgi:uncharacterized membrane protein
MNLSIGIGLSVIGSFFAAFFLFAIAFNTPFADLRMSFVPIYLSLIVLCLISSIIARGRIAPILISALALPVLMLLYIASQNESYYVDTIVVILLCFVVSSLARRAAINKEKKKA